jgi:hypothetical protein
MSSSGLETRRILDKDEYYDDPYSTSQVIPVGNQAFNDLSGSGAFDISRNVSSFANLSCLFPRYCQRYRAITRLNLPFVRHPLSNPAARDVSLTLWEAVRSREFYVLWLTFFFNQQAIGFITTMYKAYGQTFIFDDRFLALVGGAASIFNSSGRVLWGHLADKTSYRVNIHNVFYLGGFLIPE